ncbi:MAG: threonine synthase [Methylobacteriaceae bacterium]|jgi:threonine synthase|nr:threonine synthase [Methylobacteriaceae bacterium]
MRLVSTRGRAAPISFVDAMLSGLAPDGGLYVPGAYPQLRPEQIRAMAGKSYEACALELLTVLTGGEISHDALAAMIDAAYATFRHPAVCPLRQVDNGLFFLELFHGPTLAFKDVAMQLLGRMMNSVLEKENRHATIVGATSGDTGGAAIEAFRGLERTDVFILFPDGRVSDVQRRQMTAVADANVHALAVDGSFDDCQAILKALFGDAAFRDEVRLSGVNSINWARVAAQTVYYFTAAAALGAPERAVSFAVPTGNFGDVLAGWVAKRMGLPVETLVIGVNANDILARTYETGTYSLRSVVPTTSPSMDIQVSSNFERLLFEEYHRDSVAVSALMQSLSTRRAFSLSEPALAKLRDEFFITSVDEAAVAAEIRRFWQNQELLVDPHSAVGLAVARRRLADVPGTPVIALGTAHPAKFPDAVEAAAGVRPALPERLKILMSAPERMTRLPADTATVAAFIRGRARAARC